MHILKEAQQQISNTWNTWWVKSIILMFALALPPAGFVQCISLLV